MENLNKSQVEAITTTEGYVRVIAGAGTGKTRALAHRFAYLVNEMGILPGNILCVTFTNKSANEMRQRIHRLTGDNDTGYINTFHGFCVSILQEDSNIVSYPKSFLVLDNSDIDDILSLIYEERGLTLRDMKYKDARDMIEIRKLKKEPEYYLDMIHMSIEGIQNKYLKATTAEDIIFYGYLYQEKKCFALDYNDLIKFTLYIFKENEDIKKKWQNKLEYMMIDEFQDIDSLQYELMKVLSEGHGNLFVVGDPDQTIYTWRGADIRYLLDFDENFPDVKTIMMLDNYRSTPEILNAANSLINKNKNRIAKNLNALKDGGDTVTYHHCKNAEEEALTIANKIKMLKEFNVSYNDIAVLYRAHYITRSIEEVFIKEKIPYVIYSGVQFFGRMEIKDALSYLRMIAYKDDISFLRIVNVPKRNIGKSRMERIKSLSLIEGTTLYETMKNHVDDEVFKGTKAKEFIDLIEAYSSTYEGRIISEILSSILDESGYEEALRTEGNQDRLDNLAELKQSVFEYETSCGEEASLDLYLKSLALFTNSDAVEVRNKVKLMTVHSAKGLEFPHVFLPGLNEGMFPSRKVRTLEAMEEERRLSYVAFTRAEKSLYLSDAEGRTIDGSPRFPSRFILDVDPVHLRFIPDRDEKLIAEARHNIEIMNKYLPEKEANKLKVGQRIMHSIMGKGTILSIDEEKFAYVIQFDELKTQRTLTMKAKLEVLNVEN